MLLLLAEVYLVLDSRTCFGINCYPLVCYFTISLLQRLIELVDFSCFIMEELIFVHHGLKIMDQNQCSPMSNSTSNSTNSCPGQILASTMSYPKTVIGFAFGVCCCRVLVLSLYPLGHHLHFLISNQAQEQHCNH